MSGFQLMEFLGALPLDILFEIMHYFCPNFGNFRAISRQFLKWFNLYRARFEEVTVWIHQITYYDNRGHGIIFKNNVFPGYLGFVPCAQNYDYCDLTDYLSVKPKGNFMKMPERACSTHITMFTDNKHGSYLCSSQAIDYSFNEHKLKYLYVTTNYFDFSYIYITYSIVEWDIEPEFYEWLFTTYIEKTEYKEILRQHFKNIVESITEYHRSKYNFKVINGLY